MRIYFSNFIENLLDQLKKDLFCNKQSPFSHRLIVVPSPAVKTWLMQQIAKEFGIAMGIEITYLEQTLSRLQGPRYDFPSLVALSFALEKEIKNALLKEKDNPVWEPVRNYLKMNNLSVLSPKGKRRLAALSETLAPLFQQYGIYGKTLIKEWEEKNIDFWQAILWRKLFCENNYSWTYPSKAYENAAISISRDTSVYLFSMSYLSRVHHQFLTKLGASVPINYYLLSPCQEFWSDILSDKESSRLQRYWKKRGVSEGQQEALEEYLSDRNPLLANYGRLGREMAKTLEECDADIEPLYGFKQEPLSFLQAVQSDLCLMRNIDESEPPNLKNDDNSVQVHMVTDHLREVEVIYDLILEMIEKRNLLPEEIIVMAPHIGEYAPYIKSIFAGKELGFQIMDLSTPLHNLSVQCFINLLELALSRWDVVSILTLLQSEPFRKKHQISLDELEQITVWLKNTNVRWGEDANHREELLQRDHKGACLIEKNNKGSFDDAIGQLLLGLVKENDGLIDASQGGLLGKFIDLLKNLKKDLSPINNNTKKGLDEWVIYLKDLIEAHIELDDEAESIILGQFSLLQKIASEIGAFSVDFFSLKKRLKNLLQSQQGGYHESHLHAVRFCSLLPMRAIPAKAIIVMGMQEGPFPKKESHLSLNQCLEHPKKVDFCPTLSDYDRFLFLETLLSAREFLYFTYQGISVLDGKSQPPNLLLTGLLHYIKKAYNSEIVIKKHPRFAFEEESFYLNRPYLEAKGFFNEKRMPTHQFLKGYTSPIEDESVIDIKELEITAKNPIRTYLNSSLKLFLRQKEEALLGNEAFDLTHLERYLIEKRVLKEPLEKVLETADLPQGIFNQVERERIIQDVAKMKLPDTIFSITLSEDCKEPFLDNQGNWIVPPLKVGEKIIIGSIPEVFSDGLFIFSKLDKADLIKAWPKILIFHEAVKKYQIPVNVNIHFGRDAKTVAPFFTDAKNYLSSYCNYYNQCRKEATHLLPEWIHPILYEDEKTLQKKIDATLPTFDIYLNWLYRGDNLPKARVVKEKWQLLAKELYQDLLESGV